MTDHADITIIGGGVHGASLAFHLARADVGKVVLLEQNELGSGPTGQSGAMIRPLFVVPAYLRLVLEATRMFENWSECVGGDAGFVQNGFLRWTGSLEPEDLGGDVELMRNLGAEFKTLDKHELAELAPTARYRETEIAVIFPKGGYADPLLTTESLGRAAQHHGADIREGVSVTGITANKGRVETVQTNRGNISTRTVINCGGAWSRRLAAMIGVKLPIEVHRQPTCLFSSRCIVQPDSPIWSDGVNRIYFRQLGSEVIRAALFGWTEDAVDPNDYDETISRKQIGLVRQAMTKRSQQAPTTTGYGGFSSVYDMTPDGHPVISDFPEVEGFWCNCGWSGNGFASAPALGHCLAQMITGQKSDIDLSMFKWPRPSGVEKMVY